MSQLYRDLWARAEDGLRLHARSYGDPAAPAVVALPGLTRQAADFHDLAVALAPGPRHVVAVDYRGRGRSDRDPDPSGYTPQTELSDLFRLLDDHGIASAAFVGTSRGGILTMLAAAARPGLVRGAVLNDIGPVIERAGLLRIKGYVGRLPPPADPEEAARSLERLFGRDFPALDAADWRSWAAATWEERDGRLSLTYDPALARTLDELGPDTEIPTLWPFFAALREIPVLVVRGATSDLLSPETVAAMAAAHPDLQVVTVPGEGHAPLLRGAAVLHPIRRLVDRALAA